MVARGGLGGVEWAGVAGIMCRFHSGKTSGQWKEVNVRTIKFRGKHMTPRGSAWAGGHGEGVHCAEGCPTTAQTGRRCPIIRNTPVSHACLTGGPPFWAKRKIVRRWRHKKRGRKLKKGGEQLPLSTQLLDETGPSEATKTLRRACYAPQSQIHRLFTGRRPGTAAQRYWEPVHSAPHDD